MLKKSKSLLSNRGRAVSFAINTVMHENAGSLFTTEDGNDGTAFTETMVEYGEDDAPETEPRHSDVGSLRVAPLKLACRHIFSPRQFLLF